MTTTTAIKAFEPTKIFTYTNGMLDSLMPVLYIILGLALAFIIYNLIKNNFR
ncbi:MAG: hypothetical protein SA378_11250 [Sedimentibacter sp.]|uniref:hypothetical protein n=1 Tax=Sedimentibacter sp. TaxID=1960295 RepID=UPI0029816DE0|nr:hypothetical protein [Sedimentibacter sp.]MDW5300691.1 hypothetical protein [Sedimentibacter sp.]